MKKQLPFELVEAGCAFVKTVAGTALHADQSKVQSQKMIALCAARGCGERLADVLAAISGAGFLPDDLKALIDTLNASPGLARADTGSTDYKKNEKFDRT